MFRELFVRVSLERKQSPWLSTSKSTFNSLFHYLNSHPSTMSDEEWVTNSNELILQLGKLASIYS
jgi:hypothetical protein